MTVLFIKNELHESPGMIQTVLDAYGVKYAVVELARGDLLPAPEQYNPVIILGGTASANDTTPLMHKELAFVRQVLERRIPVLGICLGLQVLVKAAGGQVVRNQVREVGWKGPDGNPFTISLTVDGNDDSLLNGVPVPAPIFHLHGETVVLTSSMRLLATGHSCTNQIVRVQERTYGIQGHLELTEDMFAEWLRIDGWLQKMDAQALHRDYQRIRKSYEQNACMLITNFLRIAELLH